MTPSDTKELIREMIRKINLLHEFRSGTSSPVSLQRRYFNTVDSVAFLLRSCCSSKAVRLSVYARRVRLATGVGHTAAISKSSTSLRAERNRGRSASMMPGSHPCDYLIHDYTSPVHNYSRRITKQYLLS